MKRIYFCIAVLLLLASNGFCSLPNFSVVTYSIDSYENRWMTDLGVAGESASSLTGSFQNNLKSKYPNTRFEYASYFDAGVSKSTFAGTVPDNYNFVFYHGHGRPNYITMWSKDQYVTAKKFTGNTYWALFNSCNVFERGFSNPEIWFNGIHSILGYGSGFSGYDKYRHYYKCGPLGLGACSYTRASSYAERDFVTNWVSNKQTIWDSFKNAVYKWIYDEGGIGIEPKIVYRYGYVDGEFFEPWNEKFENFIPKPVFVDGSFLGVGSRWSVLGKPAY